MGKTAFQKIVAAHLLMTLPDGRMVLKIDKRFCHEITTPNAIIDAKGRGCDVICRPNDIKAMIDHVSPAKDTLSAVQGKILRDWCKEHSIEFLDVGRNGVCHAIIPENGWIWPGETAVMGDSHTCTHGAFCAFTAGVGTTDLQIAIATGLWVCPPQKVIRVNFNGKLPNTVFAKDLILTLINKIGVKGATNAVLEFGGTVIEDMTMDARMTITNMAVEAGATSGMMMVDKTTMDYLYPVAESRVDDNIGLCKILDAMNAWNSDPDAEYDQVIDIDVTFMEPVMTQNYSPGDVVPVKDLAGKKVDQVYIGSCTNGRLEDLRIAAQIFSEFGNVADGVRCVVNPATPTVWRQAKDEGLFDIFDRAGCCITNPSCGACLGLSCGVLAPGEVCVSTTNRNFPGRMGANGIVHLASPATAAWTAIKGVVTTPGLMPATGYFANSLAKAKPTNFTQASAPMINFRELAKSQSGDGKDFSGKVFYLPITNVDTDQIIPAKYLTEVDKVEMGKHCLEDAAIPAEDRPKLFQSQILVAGENFGCGSSREHAPWALDAAGIQCIIAPSFARIFQENMFANGLLCIELSQQFVDYLGKECPTNIGVELEIGLLSCYKDGLFSDGSSVLSIPFKLTDHQKNLLKNGGSVGVMLNLAADLQQEGKL